VYEGRRESQWEVWNWALNGYVRRSSFVFFSYSLREATKMAFRLEEDVGVGDMSTAVRMASG
jgi:hypothetical protein